MKLQAKVKLENKLKSIKIKIGILGGTFDPAHKGHLQISKEAKIRFDLKNVILAVTKKNPFKNQSKLELKKRTSFLFVSHRIDEVLKISDRIYVMKDGKVVADRKSVDVDIVEFHNRPLVFG